MNAKTKLIVLTAFSMVAAIASNIFLTDSVFAGSSPSVVTPLPPAATPSGATPAATPPPLVVGNSTSGNVTSKNATSGNMTK